MSSYSSGRKRSKMPPPLTQHKDFVVNQIVWVKVKGHQIWPGTILTLPKENGTSSKAKYECNFFNNTDLAYVPASGLFDFVKNFSQFAPKLIKQSARDIAIVDAVCELDDHILVEERKRDDLASLIKEAKAEIAAEEKEEKKKKQKDLLKKAAEPASSDTSAEEEQKEEDDASSSLESQPKQEKSAVAANKKGAKKPTLLAANTSNAPTASSATPACKPNKRQMAPRKKLISSEDGGIRQLKKSMSKPDLQPLVDLPEEFGSSGNEQPNSSKSENDAKNETLLASEMASADLLSSIQDTNMQSMEVKPSPNRQLLSPEECMEAKKPSVKQTSTTVANKKVTNNNILGKRRIPPQKVSAMLEDKKPSKATSESNCTNTAAKEAPQLLTQTESEKSKADPANIAVSQHVRYTKSKSMAMPTLNSGALDIKRVNDFLRLLIVNHQRTVKQLALNPEAKNPARSFDTYLRHLKLVKRISEQIWDKPDWYSASMIIQSKVMKGLWVFVSYCETYREDCVLLNRAHVLLFLIIQMFQSIINNSVKAKHKNSFKKQRMSMLPKSANGNANNTANSFSDRHSMVSGTAPFHQEQSDIEFMSIGPPSEAGSLFDTTQNAQQASDERRELDQAYKDLYNQIHGKAARKSSGTTQLPAKSVDIPHGGESQQGVNALNMSKNFWMHMP